MLKNLNYGICRACSQYMSKAYAVYILPCAMRPQKTSMFVLYFTLQYIMAWVCRLQMNVDEKCKMTYNDLF